jgi:hypothetical protein
VTHAGSWSQLPPASGRPATAHARRPRRSGGR